MSEPEQWTCKCKTGYEKLFAPAVSGASCDIEIACDAQQPMLDENGDAKLYSVYESDDQSGNPVFTDGYVYGDRLTSYNGYTEQCIVPTTKVHRADPFHIDYYTVGENADPTCKAQQYSNKCTIDGPGHIWATIRGSNNPGDPEEFRVSPAFALPPPFNMQVCPDNWTGDGTPSNPCTPSDGSVQLILFEDGQSGRDWYPLFTNIEDVLKTEVGGSFGTKTYADNTNIPWKTVNTAPLVKNPNCYEYSELNLDTYDTDIDNYPLSSFCKGPSCAGALGNKKRSWDASTDGPLFDDETKPYFVTGLKYGGQCTCDNFTINTGDVTVGQRPAYNLPGGTDNENAWWNCVSDSCWNKDIEKGYFNGTECECENADDGQISENDFETAISWSPDNEPPRCISDPCNPGGFASSRTDTLREYVPVDCIESFVCKNNKCYYRSEDDLCSTDADCSQISKGLENATVCSSDGVCLFEDLERTVAGTKCNCPEEDDTAPCIECAMGSHLDSEKGCSSHCICGFGFEQREQMDNPLQFVCTDMCDPNPCINGGKCSITADGLRQCTCIPCFTGDRCETLVDDGKPGDSCEKDEDCCTGYCDAQGDPANPTVDMRCAQPKTDWDTGFPTQLIECTSADDCPNNSKYACHTYSYGKYCFADFNCDSDSDCIDHGHDPARWTGECKARSWAPKDDDKYCEWTDPDDAYTSPSLPAATQTGDSGLIGWGDNEFECMEGKWNLMDKDISGDDSLRKIGTYDMYRMPGADNAGLFVVDCAGDCSDDQYRLQDGFIFMQAPASQHAGHFKYYMTT